MFKIACTVSILTVCMVLFSGLPGRAQDAKPVPVMASDAKLEIRNAQVEFMNAKAADEATPQHQVALEKRAILNATVRRKVEELKVNESEFQLQEDLSFKDMRPTPAPKEAPKNEPKSTPAKEAPKAK